MSIARLEVLSARGDESIGRYKFVVHGTSNATDAVSILDAGLSFIEGRPTLSTNLVHAYDWTVNPEKQAQSLGHGGDEGQPGSIMLCEVPPNLFLGHGVFTSAYIDRTLRRVSGAPLRYAAARKQLSLYLSRDTEGQRVHVEAEVANGFPLAQQPQHTLEARFVLGSFEQDPSLATIINQVSVALKAMQPLDVSAFERALVELFIPARGVNRDNIRIGIRQMLEGTAESVIMSRLRMMRWQGLALLGYSFVEGRQTVKISVAGTMSEHLARIDDFGRGLATSQLFSGNLEWLKDYGARRLELMKVEAEGTHEPEHLG